MILKGVGYARTIGSMSGAIVIFSFHLSRRRRGDLIRRGALRSPLPLRKGIDPNVPIVGIPDERIFVARSPIAKQNLIEFYFQNHLAKDIRNLPFLRIGVFTFTSHTQRKGIL